MSVPTPSASAPEPEPKPLPKDWAPNKGMISLGISQTGLTREQILEEGLLFRLHYVGLGTPIAAPFELFLGWIHKAKPGGKFQNRRPGRPATPPSNGGAGPTATYADYI